jgi:FHA domain-containing protein
MERHILYYAGNRLILDPERSFLLGRDKTADILLDERTVSRSHARLSFDGAAWQLEDLQSTNGTQINYTPVTTTKLRDGDHISIGPFVCIYRIFTGGSDTEREFDSLLNETLILERKIRALAEGAHSNEQRDNIYDLKHFLNALLRRMNALANIDRLTGLFNRRRRPGPHATGAVSALS